MDRVLAYSPDVMITVSDQLAKARRSIVEVEKGSIGVIGKEMNFARSSCRRGGEKLR